VTDLPVVDLGHLLSNLPSFVSSPPDLRAFVRVAFVRTARTVPKSPRKSGIGAGKFGKFGSAWLITCSVFCILPYNILCTLQVLAA
jgi:hypothetical protein